jgi:hypothetical protein
MAQFVADQAPGSTAVVKAASGIPAEITAGLRPGLMNLFERSGAGPPVVGAVITDWPGTRLLESKRAWEAYDSVTIGTFCKTRHSQINCQG